jgi:hypothetical protein
VTGDLIEDPDRLAAAEPLGFTPQQVLLSDHFENGTDILRHAAVNQHQALLKFLASFARNFGFGEDFVIGKQAAAADAELGIALRGANAVDELDARPDAAGILPAAAASTQPFAQDGARGDQPAVMLFHPSGKERIWPVARMQTAMMQASRLVETASREPLGMSFTLLTISMP